MIKCNKGTVQLDGSLSLCIPEFACIARALHTVLTARGVSAERAKTILEESIKAASLSDAEIDAKIKAQHDKASAIKSAITALVEEVLKDD